MENKINQGNRADKNARGTQGITQSRWYTVIKVLFALFIMSAIASFFVGIFIEDVKYGNVARIRIDGVIASDGNFGDVSSRDIIELIAEAQENPDIKAILFEINSPGGSPVGSYEIADAIKKTKADNKTTVALIRETGASGAYWIASSTDHIIANPLSMTGSIGVYGSYLEFSGFLNRYNVTYERLVAGKYKDTGSPFKKLNADEKSNLQEKIDDIYDYFITEVGNNRDLPYDYVRNLSTGEVFTGMQARKLGLVDELGSFAEAEDYLKEKLNESSIEYVDYEQKETLLDVLSQISNEFAFKIGNGIGSSLKKDDFVVKI